MAPMEMEDLRQLPIDISYSKLAEYLVDRRKLPSDWRKRMVKIRSQIAAALPGLPKDADPWFLTLGVDSVGYLEARRVKEILSRSVPQERNVFGRLSGIAGDWEAVIRAYEKDHVYLGEAAQIMVQNVTYDIPFYKKQLAKLQQQLADLERKEAEFKRNAAASASRYVQACQELGIQGENVRAELLSSAETLPDIFAEVVEILCGDTVRDGLEYYQAFSLYAHSEDDASTVVLETLREVRTNPATFLLSSPAEEERQNSKPEDLTHAASEEDDLSAIQWDTGEELAAGSEGATDSKQAATEEVIQWDIDLENSPIVEGDYQENEEAGISWDIDVEDAGKLDEGEHSKQVQPVEEAVGEAIISGSYLSDMTFRNSILNDLLELKSFLSLRVQELQSTDSSAVQMQAVAPAAVQQHGAEALKKMAAEVSKALSLLTSNKTRDLLMILTSKRFLDRLEASMQQKKQHEMKMLDSLKEIGQKRVELRNAISSSWPKQEALLSRTREVKLNAEKALSSLYDGRPVNIIGEINTTLS